MRTGESDDDGVKYGFVIMWGGAIAISKNVKF